MLSVSKAFDRNASAKRLESSQQKNKNSIGSHSPVKKAALNEDLGVVEEKRNRDIPLKKKTKKAPKIVIDVVDGF